MAFAVVLLAAAFLAVTWFDTIIGPADFIDVVDSGQRGGLIGALSDAESAWFQGLVLIPIVLALLLLLTSLPRSRTARIVSGILWLVPAAAYLIALPFLIADEIRLTGTSAFYADNQTERILTAVAVTGLFILLMVVLAWVGYRGRSVGLAAIATAIAMAATAIHLVLTVKLLQGTGPRRSRWRSGLGWSRSASPGWLWPAGSLPVMRADSDGQCTRRTRFHRDVTPGLDAGRV